MSEQCLIAEYKSIDDARIALEVLETDRFTNDSVSVITRSDDQAMAEVARLESHESDSPPAKGAVGVGAATGGALATPLAVATLIGPFMVAGPLAGMAAGAAVGGLFSSTQRWGVQHDVGKEYEQRVRDGSVLVIVHDEDPIRVDDAESLLKTTDHASIERFHAE